MPTNYRLEIVKISQRFPNLRFGQFLYLVIEEMLDSAYKPSEDDDVANAGYRTDDEMLYEACKAYATRHQG